MSYEVLVVDDEAGIRNLIQGILEDEGYKVQQADSAKSALNCFEERSADVVILDIWLKESESDGLQVLERLKISQPNVPVIMISGHGNIQTAVQAIKMGAYDFIEKPFKSDRLLLMIKRALELKSLQKENSKLREMSSKDNLASGQVIGSSEYAERLRQTIVKVSSFDSRVLISGEAGSGKSFIARRIHESSDHSDRAFISVNCHALNADDFETKLVGRDGKAGFLEKANKGTLYFDEISELSCEAQGKFLRILQDGVFNHSISGDVEKFHVRIITSTSKDIKSLVEVGDFRMDLFYRLNVVSIELPSLLDRMFDVPSLIGAFSDLYSRETGLNPIAFDEKAMDALKGYSWPGNIRQLKNFVEHSMIMSAGEKNSTGKRILTVSDLTADILGQSSFNTICSRGEDQLLDLPMREARETFERDYLTSQLSRFDGNISKTARFVGMERSALHRKLKSLEVIEEVEQAVRK